MHRRKDDHDTIGGQWTVDAGGDMACGATEDPILMRRWYCDHKRNDNGIKRMFQLEWTFSEKRHG